MRVRSFLGTCVVETANENQTLSETLGRDADMKSWLWFKD